METVHLIFIRTIDFFSISVGGISIFWLLVILSLLYIVWRIL